MGFPEVLAAGDKTVLGILGELIEYAPLVGSPGNVRAVFDPQFKHQLGLGAARPAGEMVVGPAVFVRLVDLPLDPVMGVPVDPTTDTPVITIRGITYRLREVMKDGEGGVLLHLMEK